MWNNTRIWIQNHYDKVLNSIAFYPAFIGIVFLFLSILLNVFDSSDTGQYIKANLKWLSLNDASTARSIVSAIVSGVISLSVFSFSMVMIVLNQAASQLSNRVLDKLIGNRFQQIVLGIYIGTIVYGLFLLSTIRDIDSGIYVPALSTYILIAITITDIFLFIYFLHYITQSVKYEVIVQRIYKDTLIAMEHTCSLQKELDESTIEIECAFIISSTSAGIFEHLNQEGLLKICVENDCVLSIAITPGTFVLHGSPLLKANKKLSDEVITNIHKLLYLHSSESIDQNFFYGFRQLMEVAIKALSPGINDPGTAVVSLRALFQLLAYRMAHYPSNSIRDDKNTIRLLTKDLSFEQIFTFTILPVWDYGKSDRLIKYEMHHLLQQLQALKPHTVVGNLLQQVVTA